MWGNTRGVWSESDGAPGRGERFAPTRRQEIAQEIAEAMIDRWDLIAQVGYEAALRLGGTSSQHVEKLCTKGKGGKDSDDRIHRWPE